MKYIYWIRIRAGRLLVILLALFIYCLLLTVDALRFFSHTTTDFSSLFRFGFSALTALLFLAIGSLVWLYARSRRVALALFCFSFTMMVSFAVQTGAKLDDPLLSAIGVASSALSLALFASLLLLFPRNYLSLRSLSNVDGRGVLRRSRRYYRVLLLRGYLVGLALLSVVAALYSIPLYLLPLHLPSWVDTVDNSYYLLTLVGILVTIIISYRQSSLLREHQQQRIFVGGVILAFTPLLLLTVLPLTLNLPAVDGQFSAITLALLPLALGYSILRYQILVFDMYVRRAVAWMVGSIGLAVLGYLVFTFGSAFLSKYAAVYLACIVVVMGVLGPCVWWLAKVVTERLFFSEMLHYRRLIKSSDIITDEAFDLDEASQLLTLAAVNTFETEEVCLFVLDDDTGYYRLYPVLKDDEASDAPRRSLVQRLFSVTRGAEGISSDWLEADAAIIERIASAKRPLLLSEASKIDGELPSGLARYLATTLPLDRTEPLLAPVRVQGKMVGVLVLGERGDHQQYAGPDFEAIHLLLVRFSSVLETARLYAKTC